MKLTNTLFQNKGNCKKQKQRLNSKNNEVIRNILHVIKLQNKLFMYFEQEIATDIKFSAN